MMQIRKIMENAISIRLSIAFVLGLLIGIFAGKVGAGLQNLVPYLLFPLVIGIVGVFTVSAKNPRPYLMALGTGLIAWVGIGVYLLILATRTASDACSVSCSNANFLMALLIVYLLAGLVLVALGALLTCTLVRYYRQGRNARL